MSPPARAIAAGACICGSQLVTFEGEMRSTFDDAVRAAVGAGLLTIGAAAVLGAAATHWAHLGWERKLHWARQPSARPRAMADAPPPQREGA